MFCSHAFGEDSQKECRLMASGQLGTVHKADQSYALQAEVCVLTNLPLWSRRPNHRVWSTKMPPRQSYWRRVACQLSTDDQTRWLFDGVQAPKGERWQMFLLDSSKAIDPCVKRKLITKQLKSFGRYLLLSLDPMSYLCQKRDNYPYLHLVTQNSRRLRGTQNIE